VVATFALQAAGADVDAVDLAELRQLAKKLAGINLSTGGYDHARGLVYIDEARRRVGALPGVDGVTVAEDAPLGFNGGFQGSLTGYDNARFIARIYGRDYEDLRSFVEDFTELGGQLRMPVKTYSSGMRARLAFGLSLAIEFDCYLIDEVIMVGDRNFQLKCQTEIFEKRHDRALLLATHGAHYIREYCNMAVIMRNGQAEVYHDIEEALAIYEAL